MKATLDPLGVPFNSSGDASPEEDRRLWFDYLKSINDQRLQFNRSSGLTTYALLGVLAGMLYTFVPRVPDLFGKRAAVYASLVSTVLVGDIAFFLSCIYIVILIYCQGNERARALPASMGRAMGLLLWMAALLGSLFGVLHWWLVLKVPLPSRFAKYSIAGIGAWWLVAVLGWIFVFDWSTRRSRALKVRPLMPYSFGAFGVGSEAKSILGTATACFLLGILAASDLFTYLRTSQVRWLDSLGSAAVVLIGLSITGVLFLRGIQKANTGYESLQRDILLDNLSPKEIKTRFIRDTLGSDVSAWLDELTAVAKNEDDKLKLVCEAVASQLEQIRSINTSYRIERASRAKTAADQIEPPIREYRSSMEVLTRQLKQLIDANKAEQDQQALQQWLKDMKPEQAQGKSILEYAEGLLAQLKQICDEVI